MTPFGEFLTEQEAGDKLTKNFLSGVGPQNMVAQQVEEWDEAKSRSHAGLDIEKDIATKVDEAQTITSGNEIEVIPVSSDTSGLHLNVEPVKKTVKFKLAFGDAGGKASVGK